MHRHLATTAVLAGLVAGSLAGTAGVALAAPADTCNSYSSTCPSPSVSVLPTHATRNPSTPPGTQVEGTNASRLPFTGGEIALMVVVGVGAIGAGTVFVASGRRRRSATH
ncbi:MAG: hypothetical protein ACJ735_17165 [Actinomycetes bacterium]